MKFHEPQGGLVRPSLKFCQFAVLRPTRQNRRDPNFFFAISDFLFFFRVIISVRPDSKGMSYIPISFRMINSCQNNYFKCIWNTSNINCWAINISRGNVKHVDDLTCAQNIGSLSFTPCHLHCGRSIKKLIATLLGRFTCHPMREQNCLGGKIFRAGWSVDTSFTVCNSIHLISKVIVGNPFSRRGGSLCYVHFLKKYPANVNIK